jgi:polyhydroxyalkanoate synthesis regulator phasin
MKRLTLLSILFVQSVLASDPTLLHKGDLSPNEGWLFSRELEADNRQRLMDADILKQLDASNQRVIQYHIQEKDILKQQADLWHGQADNLSKQLVQAEDRSFWRNSMFFVLGALITTAITFGVNKASR